MSYDKVSFAQFMKVMLIRIPIHNSFNSSWRVLSGGLLDWVFIVAEEAIRVSGLGDFELAG